MKQKVLFFAVLLMTLVMPSVAKAFHFSYTYQGKTLYYNIVDGHAEVVRPGTGSSFDNYVTGNVEIPSTVSYNGNDYTVTALISMSSNGTFKGCSGLTSVTIPNSVTNIDQYAFYGCSGLTSVIIPNSVTSIGRHAFNNCSSLTSVTIPNSVTSIGQYAFHGCSDLASVTIGNSVTSIGKYAFYGCSDLTTVNFNATDCTTMGSSDSPVFGGCTNLATLNIGNYVTRIPDYAFYNCSGLTGTLTIPNSVTSIGSSAFYKCSGLTGTLTIPNSVTSIGDRAFYDCYCLTGTLTIPNSVTSIGYGAFNNVKHIKYYGNASGSPWGAISMNGYTEGDLVYSNSTKTDLLAYLGSGGNVTIPNTVTRIGPKAFYNCSGLTGTLTIPNSVTSIGSSAFYKCSGLTGTLTIPNSVTSIGSSAFYNCSGLTGTLTIPDSVTIIGEYTFRGCSGLTSVTIGNSVTSIGSSAFYGCSGLTSVTIGNSVTSIDSWAFHSCSGLTEIISLALTAPVLSRYVFSYVSRRIPVYIPCGSLLSYQTFWGERFSNFEEECEEVYRVTVVNANPTIYSADGRIVVRGAEGMMVRVFDMVGREVYHTTSPATEPSALPGGIYMVKVGTLPARKVVVMR